MDTFPNGLSREKIIGGITKSLKTLGYIPPTANHGNKLRLTSGEIKEMSIATGIPDYTIWYKFG